MPLPNISISVGSVLIGEECIWTSQETRTVWIAVRTTIKMKVQLHVVSSWFDLFHCNGWALSVFQNLLHRSEPADIRLGSVFVLPENFQPCSLKFLEFLRCCAWSHKVFLGKAPWKASNNRYLVGPRILLPLAVQWVAVALFLGHVIFYSTFYF